MWLAACSHKSLLNHLVEFTVHSDDTNGSVPAKCYLHNASTLFTVIPYTSPKSKTSLIWKKKPTFRWLLIQVSVFVCLCMCLFVSVLACLCIFRCAHFLGLSLCSRSYRSNCKVNKNSANETSVKAFQIVCWFDV